MFRRVIFLRSAGCIIYEMITLKKAFNNKDKRDLRDEIVNKEIPPLKYYNQFQPILDK